MGGPSPWVVATDPESGPARLGRIPLSPMGAPLPCPRLRSLLEQNSVSTLQQRLSPHRGAHTTGGNLFSDGTLSTTGVHRGTSPSWSASPAATLPVAEPQLLLHPFHPDSHPVSSLHLNRGFSSGFLGDNDSPAATTAPRVSSIVRQAPSPLPTGTDNLTWRVTFKEAVQNVDAAWTAASPAQPPPSPWGRSQERMLMMSPLLMATWPVSTAW